MKEFLTNILSNIIIFIVVALVCIVSLPLGLISLIIMAIYHTVEFIGGIVENVWMFILDKSKSIVQKLRRD